jgi:hypothetical protein
MAFKRTIDKLEDVDEKYRGLYTERDDGRFLLDSEVTADSADQIEEFRTSNRDLYERNQAMETQLGELAATVKSMDEEKSKGEEKEQTDRQRIDALEESNRAKDEENKTLATAAKRGQLRDQIKSAAAAGGVRKTALDDFADMALPQWGEDDGGSPVRKVNGQPVLSTDRAGHPQNMSEFVTDMGQEKAFYFDASKGDGADGGGEGGGVKKVIPNDPVQIGLHAEAIGKGEVEIEGFQGSI